MSQIPTVKIGRKDVLWNYASTFLQIGSGIIIFPFILRMLPAETIGVWSVFVSINVLVNLLDFGFEPSFSRNITYIFSGVNTLKKNGISTNISNESVNYNLLSSTIRAMKWFYLRVALITILILSTAGTFYLHIVLKRSFHSDPQQIWIAWIVFCIISSYNIYTIFYDSLMIGKGMVKRNRQFITISQIAYFSVTVICIYCGLGLIAIVFGQTIASIIKRTLSYHCFFNREMKLHLLKSDSTDYKNIIKVITPNSIKIGITGLGAFLALQSSILLGSLYIPLEQIASYNISTQVVNVIAALGSAYYFSFTPQIAGLRVRNNNTEIRKLFFRCMVILFITFICCGLCLIYTGNILLTLLKSNTMLLPTQMISIILISTFLEKNHALAGGFLLAKNEVPFFKASIISGFATVILLFISFRFTSLGLWSIVLAPGLVQLTYQNWKWPLMLLQELRTKNPYNNE